MNLKEIIIVISLIQLTSCETESTEYNIRETKYGKIKGYINDIKDVGKVERYLGVPYARPPIGIYRFEGSSLGDNKQLQQVSSKSRIVTCRVIQGVQQKQTLISISIGRYKTKKRRFYKSNLKDAEDPLPWREDVLSTIKLPAACAQTGMDWRYIQRHHPNFKYESEDCLYLNIYVPVNKTKSLLEVLIHIHGGSNEVGMGGMFHGDVLAIKGEIIVITFNYRLGALGFLSGSSSQFRGNYGMTDQIKAFLWVQENIHYFDGDRNKVTITGHSAGGCDVGLHTISPLSKGLFRYAIMESGSPLSFWCVSKNENGLIEVIDEFAEDNNCYVKDNMLQVKECLKKIDYTDLTQHKFKKSDKFTVYGANIDGVFLTEDPDILLKNGEINGESFMTGVVQNESTEGVLNIFNHEGVDLELRKVLYYVPSFSKTARNYQHIFADLLKDEYLKSIDVKNRTQFVSALAQMMGDKTFLAPTVELADILANRQKDVYFYHFNHRSNRSSLNVLAGVSHGTDVFYLFGVPFTGHEIVKFDEEDKVVSSSVMKLWSSFVKTGQPELSNSDPQYLPKYTVTEKTYIDIKGYQGNVNLTIRKSLRAEKVAFWNHCLPLLQRVLDKNSCICSHQICVYLIVILLIMNYLSYRKY